MAVWFTENIGTIFITLALIAIVTAIILGMIKDKKNGRSCCGGNCAKCAGCCTCKTGVQKKRG